MTNWLSQLVSLRSMLLRCLLVTAIVFLCLLYFSNDLFYGLALPLLHHLQPQQKLIATQLSAGFLIPLKFTFIVALMLAIPYLLIEFWRFIAPGLYQHEKMLFRMLFVASTSLCYLGMLFAYFLVFPLVFRFLLQTAPQQVMMMPDITLYFGFAIKLLFAFAIAFQMPVVVLLLIKLNIISYQTLNRQRPYVIVIAFVVGMLLTPPDVISQVLLALPMYALFEFGLLLSRFFVVRKTNLHNRKI